MDEKLLVLHLASARDDIDAVSEHVWDDLSGYARSELTDAYRHIDNAIDDIETSQSQSELQSQPDSASEFETERQAHAWDKFTEGEGPERL
jgi:hypothetical protein